MGPTADRAPRIDRVEPSETELLYLELPEPEFREFEPLAVELPDSPPWETPPTAATVAPIPTRTTTDSRRDTATKEILPGSRHQW